MSSIPAGSTAPPMQKPNASSQSIRPSLASWALVSTPPAPIVANFRALGGIRVTAGSDAHRADSFAYGLGHAYAALAAAGFEALAFRRHVGDARAGERLEIPARVLARKGA